MGESVSSVDGLLRGKGRRPSGNPLAILSLALAFLSLPLFAIFAADISKVPGFLISGIATIICGHKALHKIGSGKHPVYGYPMARVGLWMGYGVTLVFPFLYGMSYTGGCRMGERAFQSKAINNCRQIAITLHLYAVDHSGEYPDAALPQAHSSNEVFHLMFVEDQTSDEMIFGSPLSRHQPDGEIGAKPDFLEALQPGENHWAMTRGLTEISPANMPLVFENTAVPSWPPKWNADLAGTNQQGRTWAKGKVIVGFNDCSVFLQTVKDGAGPQPLKPTSDKAPVFPLLDSQPTILDVQDK